jgi:hypothetical protein
MMRRLVFAVLFSLVTSGVIRADEQVTLKSGTRLVGQVTYSSDNKSITVKIGDSSVSLPMSEVDIIGPVGSTPSQTPDRLLMIALESQLQQGTAAGQMGLLAEAYRLAPKDPRIAYWYAKSLVDSGFGNAAKQVVDANRQAIDAAYPGMLISLEHEILQRLNVENLPPDLLKRIDQITASIGKSPIRNDRIPMFVRFALVDEGGTPIERKAFRVSANGQDERLESFSQGNYLYSFDGYRNNNPNCKVTVNWPGLESKTIDLNPSSDSVADAGKVVIKRYSDSDKVSRTIVVVDQNDKSISNATVHLRANIAEGDYPAETLRTDANGRVKFMMFPMNYAYSVVAKGYKSEDGGIEFNDEEQQDDVQVELYPQMSATVRVAWVVEPLQGDASSTSGETVLELGGEVPRPYGMEGGNLLRAVQVRDRVVLQSGPPHFGGPMAPGATSWIRRAPAAMLQNEPFKFFEGIDLKKVDSLQSEFESPETDSSTNRPPYAPFSILVKQGEVYAGKFPSRDMRTGQPALVSVKVFVEKISTQTAARD